MHQARSGVIRKLTWFQHLKRRSHPHWCLQPRSWLCGTKWSHLAQSQTIGKLVGIAGSELEQAVVDAEQGGLIAGSSMMT